MGQRNARTEEFLRQHPFCCFCGGLTASTEPDHIPSRVMFRNRHWPEGYQFPACEACNRATRHDEQIVAMLTRLFPGPVNPSDENEVTERIRAVAHNYPDVLKEMRPDARQVRTAAAKYGLERPAGGTFADIPLLSVRGPLVNAAVHNFARKLFCALYYMHAEKALGPDSGIAVRWYTNLQIEADEIPRSLEPLLRGFAKLERARRVLDDQFFYRWGLTDTKDAAVFLTLFGRSFGILGFVNQRASNFHLPSDAVVLRPYSTYI
jgi:hypothetical protein